jgi:hypothetical protein
MIELIGVLVRHNRAYIPINAKMAGGGYLEVEPVYMANLTIEDLTRVFNHVASQGTPQLPPLSKEYFQARKDPMLQATGAESWKAMAKDSASYSIAWHNNQVTLYMSRLDKKGRFESDPGKTRAYPESVSLSTLAEVILEDAKSRPELTE